MLFKYIFLIFTSLVVFNAFSQSAWKTEISSVDIYNIQEDKNGNIWVLSYENYQNNRLSKFDGTNWIKYDETNGLLPANQILKFKADSQGNIWFLNPQGLIKYDGSNFSKFTKDCPSAQNFDIDKNGNIWIVTTENILQFNGSNWFTHSLPGNNIGTKELLSLQIDGNGKLWFATASGLLSYDGLNWNKLNKSNSNLQYENISSISIDNSNKIWLIVKDENYKEKLLLFDGINFTNLSASNTNLSASNNYTMIIKHDKIGNTWILNDGKSLLKFNGTNWANFSNNNYVFSNFFIDNLGNLWINSSYTLNVYPFTQSLLLLKFNGSDWRYYNSSNSGLNMQQTRPSLFFNDKKGNMWFGTQIGGVGGPGLIKLTGDGNSEICNLDELPITKKLNLDCPSKSNIVLYSNIIKSNNFEYNWTLNNNIINSVLDSIKITSDGNVKLKIYDKYCFKEKNMNFFISDTILPTPSICMVTNQKNHNLVIWENINNSFISKYRIHKLNQSTSNFELIHEQSKNEISQWLDTASRTNTNSDEYRICILDICGKETTLSNEHKTLLLSSNIGLNGTVNLSWNPYVGFEYQNFEIWRSTDGTNFIKIGSVANNSYAYIDNNPPATAWYQIRISKQNSCNPSTRGITSVNSNIISKDGKSLGLKNMENNTISIYPNPSNGSFTLKSTSTMIGKSVNIMDITGRCVYAGIVNTTSQNVSMENIENGTYFISVDYKEAIKLIKE